MNETQHDDAPGPDATPAAAHESAEQDGFDSGKLHSITDVQRSQDDRMVAGVCAGAAKFLNIDPVILRILVAAFTIVGGAGLIMYVAAWLLLPSEDAEQSIAAGWFNLDENEETIRIGGLVIAAILALTTGTGLIGGNWSTPFPWFGLILLAVFYFWVIRPIQRRNRNHSSHPSEATADAVSRQKWSPILTLATISTAILVIGCILLYANQNTDSVDFEIYVMASLVTVAAGLIVGAWFGSGGLLIPIGLALSVALALATALPAGGFGRDHYAPVTSAAVQSEYKLSVGELDVDLTSLADVDDLLGQQIEITNGVGRTVVTVPDELNVEVIASVTGGDIDVFDRRVDGNDVTIRYPADDPNGPKAQIIVHNTLGEIEVIKQ